MKPTQNGYYWLRREGEAPVVVYVFGSAIAGLDVQYVTFPGHEQHQWVSEISGEWSGPLVSPWEGEGKE